MRQLPESVSWVQPSLALNYIYKHPLHLTPRIALFVGPFVTEKYRIIYSQSSPMYDAVKMMIIIIIYVRYDHHHADYHPHLCMMRSS